MSKPPPKFGDVWTRDGYPGESLTVTRSHAWRVSYKRNNGRTGRMNEATLRAKYTLAMRDGKPVEQPDEYVWFGHVARSRLHEQSQYASRAIDGRHGYPNLGTGLRFEGRPTDYHSVKIHRDDVDEFCRRWAKHAAANGRSAP